MRKPLLAGNWKMNLDLDSSVALATAIAKRSAPSDTPEVVVCPAAVYLEAVSSSLQNTTVGLGAQNMFYEREGAFTGEISALMLLDVGCRYVILGHSERRHILGETDEMVHKKTRAAVTAGLTPIVCLGELLAEREAGRTGDVIRGQFQGSLGSLSSDQMRQVVIAYEPVWAIGTGKVATPEEAEEVHMDLRKIIADRYNGEVSEGVRILYGGSVKPGNAAELLAQPNIDGALVGGASLNADDFMGIVAAVPSKP